MNTESLPIGILGKALRSQSTKRVRDGLATSSLSPPHRCRPPSLGKGGGGGERKAWGSLTDPVGAHGVTSGKRPHSSWASEHPPSPSIKKVRKPTVPGKETGILPQCCMTSSGREREDGRVRKSWHVQMKFQMINHKDSCITYMHLRNALCK